MQNPGSLAQTYGQIITGFLSQAIISYKKIVSKEEEEHQTGLILPEGLRSIETKISRAFGNLRLDENLQKEYSVPIISYQELLSKVISYLNNFKMTFDINIFKSVIDDLKNLGILAEKGVRQLEYANPLFAININVFEENEIEEHCVSLEEALSGRLERFLYHEVAKPILIELAKQKIRSEIASTSTRLRESAFFKDFGRGTLLGKLRKHDITYGPFMEAVDLLVRSSILTLGCDAENHEFIIINPGLKPFTVLQKLLQGFKSAQVEIIEMEIAKNIITPFDKFSTYESLIGISRDIYLFTKFDPYAYL